MAAVMNVRWPISTEYGEESRYNTLLQISIGQEEVDEVITRDIHRTFPEHPQFGFAQGQQALFRVLKAYSLHDLEVRPPLSIVGRAVSGSHGVVVQLKPEISALIAQIPSMSQEQRVSACEDLSPAQCNSP